MCKRASSGKSEPALAHVIDISGIHSKITAGPTTPNGAESNSATLAPAAEITDGDRLINVASYILVVGYGTLVTFPVMHSILGARLKSFAMEPIAKDEGGGEISIKSSAKLLFFESFDTTCHIFQCTILILEWYFAVFVLGMAYEIWRTYSLFALVFFGAATAPVAIFIVVFPWTITMISMLRSLGSDLLAEEVQSLIDEGNEDNERRGESTAVNAKSDDPAVITGAVKLGAAAGGAAKLGGKDDEWHGEEVTLYDKSNKLFDPYLSPQLTEVRSAHPNAARKDFQRAEEKTICTQGMALMPPPAPVGLRAANYSAQGATGWIPSKVEGSGRAGREGSQDRAGHGGDPMAGGQQNGRRQWANNPWSPANEEAMYNEL